MARSSPRPARVALVQAPFFDPNAASMPLALLSALLGRLEVRPMVRDSSRKLHEALSRGLGRELSSLDDFREAAAQAPDLAAGALDSEIEAILAHSPELVGFSVLAYTESWTLEMALRLKKARPDCHVVLGGAQCLRENNALELARHPAVDAVAIGEADVSFPALVGALRPGAKRLPAVRGFYIKEDGRIIDTGDEPEMPELDALPYMDFSGFAMRDYGEKLYLNTSRGCVRECSFCTHIIDSKTYRAMSAARTAAEIRHQMELYPFCGAVEFSDSLVNADVRRLAELSRLLAGYRADRLLTHPGIPFGWIGQGIVHPTMTLPLLQTMRRGGCARLRYGVESGSQKVVDLMRKNFSVEQADSVIADTKAAGISAQAYVMVGFPGETERDFQLTLDFLERNAASLDEVSVSTVEIQKGSFLDRHAERYGVRLPLEDRARWTTKAGDNTWEIREERKRRVYEAAERLGLDAANKTLNRNRTGDFFPV